jgi:hypothetical protein
MITFKQHNKLFLEFFEEIEGAVKHIDHLEENIINKGADGVVEALEYIDKAIEYFVSETDYKISTKFDGSPAIVGGTDPSGKFFVASKSAFAKNPKINYTAEDIDRNHSNSPGLAEKLKLALQYLPSLNLKGIYQMDYMFDDQIKQIEKPATIDGIQNNNSFISFQPNTIKYAVSPDSPYGNEIQNSKIGVAIHIQYEVVNGILRVKKYTTSSSEFSRSKDVFVFNVLIDKQANPNHRILNMLLKDVDKKKAQIKGLLKGIDFATIQKYAIEIKTYINSEIRSGKFLDNTSISTQQFLQYMAGRFQKELNALKSEAGKLRKQAQLQATITELKKIKKSIKSVFDITKIIATLKNNLVKIFNEMTKNSYLGTYMDKGNGNWKTTSPEGFAVSKTTGGPDITKFVNRQEFSAANFQTGKPGGQPTA